MSQSKSSGRPLSLSPEGSKGPVKKHKGDPSPKKDVKVNDPVGNDPEGNNANGNDTNGNDAKGNNAKGQSPVKKHKGDPSPKKDVKDNNPLGNDPEGNDPEGDDPAGDDPEGNNANGNDTNGNDAKSSDAKGNDDNGNNGDDNNADGDLFGSIRQIITAIYNLGNRIDSLEKKLTASIKGLSETTTEIQAEVKATTQRLDRFERVNDLLFYGIPYSPDESLQQLYEKIATALKYKEADRPIVDLKRLKKDTDKEKDPPIMCQFSLRNARDTFYERYLAEKNLSLSQLGFDSNKRVYVNENLPKPIRNIKKTAFKMRSENQLQKVFIRNGIVFIQRSEDSSPEPIYHIKELDVESTSKQSA